MTTVADVMTPGVGGRLVGVVSQADVALGGSKSKTGAVVEQISQPTSVARER